MTPRLSTTTATARTASTTSPPVSPSLLRAPAATARAPPRFACLARSRPEDGTFEWTLNGEARGVVVSERQPERSDAHSSLYTFADAEDTLRQKWACVNDRGKEFVPFGDLVDPAYRPDRHVHDNSDILQAVSCIDMKLGLYTRALQQLNAQKRHLDTLAQQVTRPRKLRRTTTLLPDEVLHDRFPPYWRIPVPVFPAGDRETLRTFIDRAQMDPDKTTLGVRAPVSSSYSSSSSTSTSSSLNPRSPPTVFLTIEDLVHDAKLSRAAVTTLHAIVNELRSRCQATYALREDEVSYSIRLHCFEPNTCDEWSQDHSAHAVVTALIPVCIDPSGTGTADTPPTLDIFAEQYGRGQVEMVEGGVYAHTAKVWRMRRNGMGLRWYGVEVVVVDGRGGCDEDDDEVDYGEME